MPESTHRGPEITLSQGLMMCRLALALAPSVAAWRRGGLARGKAEERLNLELLVGAVAWPDADPQTTAVAALVVQAVLDHAYG